MSKEVMSYFKEHKINVSFMYESEEIYGVLTFGCMHFPQILIESGSYGKLDVLKGSINESGFIECREVGAQEVFFVHVDEVREGMIFCDYVTKSNPFESCNKVEVVFTGLSRWFGENRYTFIHDGVVKHDAEIDKFTGGFIYKEIEYLLSNGRFVNITNESNVKSIIDIKNTIILSKKSGLFEFTELKDLVLELRNLFSLILGAPLSIINVYFTKEQESSRLGGMYFPSSMYDLEPLKHSHDALCKFRNINNNDSWSKLLASFFGNNNFRDIWNRIIPSYKHMQFWEYDILSRVVTLEKYSTIIAKGKGFKLNRELFKKLKGKIKTAIEEFKDDSVLTPDDMLIVQGAEVVMDSLTNSSMPTFKEKYTYLMEQVSEDLRKVVSFSNGDFALIKKLRDSIAHGNNYKKIEGEGKLTYEMQLNDRLLVLLMCFAYLELGFSDQEIAQVLVNSHCPFLINANINKRELDKLAQSALFVNLSKIVNYDFLKNGRSIVLNYSVETEEYFLEENMCQNLHQLWFKSGIKNLEDFVRLNIENGDKLEFEYLHKVYVLNGDRETVHYSVILAKV